jgi:hypothetical protein
MPSVPQTMIVGSRCGRIWRNRMRGALAPIVRSASMNSRSASELVSV